VRRLLRVVAPLVVGGLVALGAHASGAEEPAQILGPGFVTVELTIENSRFDVEHLRVHSGTTVAFVVHNEDFIHHELVVGDDAVHRAHASGTHERHPPVPGEVSLPPERTAMTVYTFASDDGPGEVRFACHLPGHVAYGMEGVIEVV
jgi:uncharacterized cupredoxin-like copper-binding protein